MFKLSDIATVNIMLIDDHLMFAQGIAGLLNKILPNSKTSIFNSVDDARKELEVTTYQFIICDLLIPGANVSAFILFCKKNYPGLYIIIISSVTDINMIKSIFLDGADSYLTKAVNYSELKMALEKTYEGNKYISSDLSGKMINVFFQTEKTELTRKELEILRMIAAGKTVVQTAEELFISTSTVMSHRRNIMGKLDLHSAAELVKYAFENKLV